MARYGYWTEPYYDYYSSTDSENANEDAGYRPRIDDPEPPPVMTDDPIADGLLEKKEFFGRALSPPNSGFGPTYQALGGAEGLTVDYTTAFQVKIPLFKPDVMGYDGYDGWLAPTFSVYIRHEPAVITISNPLLQNDAGTINLLNGVVASRTTVTTGVDESEIQFTGLRWTDFENDGYTPVTFRWSVAGGNLTHEVHRFETFGPPGLTSNYESPIDKFDPFTPSNWPGYGSIGLRLNWTSGNSGVDYRYISDFASEFPVSWYGVGTMHILTDPAELEPFVAGSTRSNIVFGPVEVTFGASGAGKQWHAIGGTGDPIYISGSNGNSSLNFVHYWTILEASQLPS